MHPLFVKGVLFTCALSLFIYAFFKTHFDPCSKTVAVYSKVELVWMIFIMHGTLSYHVQGNLCAW